MRATLRILFLLTVLMGAVLTYRVWIGSPQRYDVFDFLKQRPVTATTAQPQLSPPVVVPEPAAPDSGKIPLSPDEEKTEPPKIEPGETPAVSTAHKAPDLNLSDVDLLVRVNEAYASLTEAVVPSVVSINTTTTVDVSRYVPADPFGIFGYYRRNERYNAPGLGSGVIVSDDGYVLTNHHVVAGVDEIMITTHGGQQYQAEWVGSDATVDVAVLKIVGQSEKKFPALPIGDSNRVRIGESVVAVGNPFGLSETVTRGIISAKQRRLQEGENEYFQTDTVINPGNSGGPLVNIRGQIIGLNVALYTGQQDVRVWQGVGLAIPSNEVKEVYEAIVFNKPLLRGYLGVDVASVPAQFARQVGLRSLKGALVRNVTAGSPAEKAGLKPGDVILKLGEREIEEAEEVITRVRRLDAGTVIKLSVNRAGKALTLDATLAEEPDRSAIVMKGDAAASGQSIAKSLGIQVRDLSDEERALLRMSEDSGAIVITEVDTTSPAAGQLQVNDLIFEINRDPVRTVSEFYEKLGSLPKGQNSVMGVLRGGRRFGVLLRPGA